MSFFQEMVFKGQDSRVKIATIAGTIAAVGFFAYYTILGSNTSTSDPELAPAVTEEEATKIMNAICDQMKLVAPRLIMAAENIKQQIASQGQQIDDASLMKVFLLPQLEQMIRDTQESIFEKFDVDEDEVEEAVEYYTKRGHEELIAINQNITMLYKQFGGEVDEGEDLAAAGDGGGAAGSGEYTLEMVVGMMQSLTEKMVRSTDEYTGEFISKNGVPSTQAEVERFQLGLMMETQE